MPHPQTTHVARRAAGRMVLGELPGSSSRRKLAKHGELVESFHGKQRPVARASADLLSPTRLRSHIHVFMSALAIEEFGDRSRPMGGKHSAIRMGAKPSGGHLPVDAAEGGARYDVAWQLEPSEHGETFAVGRTVGGQGRPVPTHSSPIRQSPQSLYSELVSHYHCINLQYSVEMRKLHSDTRYCRNRVANFGHVCRGPTRCVLHRNYFSQGEIRYARYGLRIRRQTGARN